MSEGFLYEPRSFWSTQSVTPSINGITRVQLPKRHFYNGERWPIQIKRVAVMALNYPLMEANAGNPSQASTLINEVGVAISVPQRYHLNSRRFALMAALMPRPTWAPLAPPVAVPGPFQPSSLWGQSMLKLDKAIFLPRMGSIEWSLSASTSRGGGTSMPEATMLYQEEGGLFAGSARTFRSQLATLNNTVFVPANSEERWPYPKTDGVAGGAPDVLSTNFWPPANHFNAQIFNRQESTRAGSTKITDLRCMIDQRNADLSAFNNGVTEQQTPLSMRVGTRIRTVNAGTKTWWWRPGAPMALTFDHITPANVYQLPEMITLGPGEQLDVELEFPQVQNTENDMQVAIALNGYAAIEG